jgi:hypothetical protein
MKEGMWFAKGVFVVWAVSIVGISATVAEAQTKTSYATLFDNTGSMRRWLLLQQEIGKLISERASPNRQSVFGFATNPNEPIASFAVGIECSADATTVRKQIGQIGVVGGQTTLIDAINAGAERMSNPVKQECDKSGEKILVVLSDGEDRASVLTIDQLVKSVKELGVKVYVVGLLDHLSKDTGFVSRSPFKKSRELLIRLATESGGRIVFPKENDSAAQIVTNLFADDYVHPKK